MRQGREAMPGGGIYRRNLIKTAAGIAGAVAMPAILGGRARAADATGTVRVVPEVDLKVLDPVWTTALITGTHANLVYDTLFSADGHWRARPQMIDTYERDEDGLNWRFKLRDGLGFHDGTPLTARDCVASIRRWAARSVPGQALMERADRLDVIDDNSFLLRFKEPFGLVPETLARGPTCFVMRTKEAETDPFTQITTAIGSGPFIFLPEEWRPGAHVAYRRNSNYRPRTEPADGVAGGKVAKVERVEWTIIPDPATATAALIAGEVDYLTNPVVDNLPLMR